MKKKTLALLLAIVLVVGCAVGGTVAWLTDETTSITNTFTVGKVDISLAESPDLNLKMVPGQTITKDPYVTVTGGSEDCWLFVKVEESSVLSSYISYGIANGWNQGDGVSIPSNVYYRQVSASSTDQTFHILTGDHVTVLDTVTMDDMNALDVANATQPTLTFTAYAIQQASFTTAGAAWAAVGP